MPLPIARRHRVNLCQIRFHDEISWRAQTFIRIQRYAGLFQPQLARRRLGLAFTVGRCEDVREPEQRHDYHGASGVSSVLWFSCACGRITPTAPLNVSAAPTTIAVHPAARMTRVPRSCAAKRRIYAIPHNIAADPNRSTRMGENNTPTLLST